MPSVLLTDSISFELGALEPWPSDVKLYQPYEVEQILLQDQANSLAVQVFLRMCGLEFQVEMRSNAEHMSPSGKLPFIKCGAFVVADLDPVVSFVANKGINLTDHLDAAQKADMRAYMSLANNILGNAELYISWCDETVLNEVTCPRYGSVYSWPLNTLLTWRKQKQVTKKLTALGWITKTLDEVYEDVDHCCNALSERLGNHLYFFNDRCTELDAVVFGHVFTLLTTPLPDNRLASIVRSYPNLVEACQFLEKTFFQKPTAKTTDDDGDNFN
ncbi:metaxin-2-like [Daphnia carinata]|uniref:metaxin-2-like n=1 Tax=Daphnia carinata TaxID=120202 RepID=UPI00257DD641|nr:metaxin-2-like [Daphnia carinata]